MAKNQFAHTVLVLIIIGKVFSLCTMLLSSSNSRVNAFLPIIWRHGSRQVMLYKSTCNRDSIRVLTTSYPSTKVLGAYATVENSTLHDSSATMSEERVEWMTKVEQLRREKKEARQRYIEIDRQRNLELKRLIHGNNKQESEASSLLIAVRVSVDDSLRRSLAMNGREKRGRMFVRHDKDSCMTTLAEFKQELHGFFRTLKRKSYILQAALPSPRMDAPWNIAGNNTDIQNGTITWWPLETDDHIIQTLKRANEYFSQQQQQQQQQEENINSSSSTAEEEKNMLIMKRPTFLLRVSQDPNYVPPTEPTYLKNMPDPLDSTTMTMISFYSFFPIQDEIEYVANLKRVWKPFHVLGRVYVAKEGINAQMAVPTNVLMHFRQSLIDVIPEAATNTDLVNVDPVPIKKTDFFNESHTPPPFTNLHIRIRPQIVADGLPIESNNTTNLKPLDLYGHSTGVELSPLDWHDSIALLQNQKRHPSPDVTQSCQNQVPILLDCRNKYETDVGTFVGAEPLNTEFFRESWDVLKERLKDTPKDAPILTYCTGGIRCVKVGAFLTQELGFQNVSRLAGGIIAYDRALQEENKNKGTEEQKKSLFIGTNYVFDNRVGRQITSDALGTCITCGAKTSLIGNCRNNNCHRRMVQCHECSSKYVGSCSDACMQRVLNSQNNMIARKRASTVSMNEEITLEDEKEIPCQTVDEYSNTYSSDLPPIYAAIEQNTKKYLPTGSHMVSGSIQGRLLCNLASMIPTGRILEIGTFTGYATASFLEGIAATRKPNVTGSREEGPFVLSLERDQRAYELAVAHVDILSRLGIGTGAAAEMININMEHDNYDPTNHHQACSFTYKDVIGCEIQKVSDALATIDQMALGAGDNADIAPFDMVFIDADKTRLLEYTEACLANDRILKKGGFMIVDNTLYKGIVLEHTGVGKTPNTSNAMDLDTLKRSRRSYQLAGKLHKFNKAIAKDERCEVVILPIRDGLSLIRKK